MMQILRVSKGTAEHVVCTFSIMVSLHLANSSEMLSSGLNFFFLFEDYCDFINQITSQCFSITAVHRCWHHGISNSLCSSKSLPPHVWPARCCLTRRNAGTMCLSRLVNSILHASGGSCQAGHAQGCRWYVERSSHSRREEATRRSRFLKMYLVLLL